MQQYTYYDEVTCRLTAKKPGSALVIEYGTSLLSTYYKQW